MIDTTESEEIILGSIMRDSTITDDLNVTAGDFHSPQRASVFTLLVGEVRANGAVDLVTAGHALNAKPIRGVTAADLHNYYQSVLFAADAERHAKIVTAAAKLRSIHDLGARLQTLAESGSWEDADAILAQSRNTLDDAEAAYTPDGTRTFHDALSDAMSYWQNTDEEHAIPTGWADLDDLFNGGWGEGQLTVLGARPAVGKSLIAACAAMQVGDNNGVGFFSLEMKELEVVSRMVANKATVDLSRIEKKDLTDEDWAKIRGVYNSQVGTNLFLHCDANTTLANVRSQVKKWAKVKKPALVIVDYLQLMTPASKSEARHEQVSELARGLKTLAMEMGIHILSLAQVNRDSVGRRPRMSDLRESGAIEAHSDNIILLDRDDENNPGEIEVLVDKNRRGDTKEISLAWQPHYARASDLWKG